MPKRSAKRSSTPKRGKKPPTATPKQQQIAEALDPSLREPPAPQSKWRPEYARIAAKMAELGAVDRQIAEALQINVQTFHAWKVTHPELSKALKPGKEVADDQVVRSLYNRAMGYSFDAVKLFVDRDGCEHTMPYVEHVAPDTIAQIFWLKNRRPDQWRDRQEVNHTFTTAEMLSAARKRALERDPVVAEQGQRAA